MHSYAMVNFLIIKRLKKYLFYNFCGLWFLCHGDKFEAVTEGHTSRPKTITNHKAVMKIIISVLLTHKHSSLKKSIMNKSELPTLVFKEFCVCNKKALCYIIQQIKISI